MKSIEAACLLVAALAILRGPCNPGPVAADHFADDRARSFSTAVSSAARRLGRRYDMTTEAGSLQHSGFASVLTCSFW